MRGWALVGWTALIVAAMCGAIVALYGPSEATLHVILRDTARASLLLFSLAFAATGANRVLPGPFSRWMLVNRRYLGVSFATSHAFHLAAIVALGPARFGPRVLILGGLGYLLIAAMTITSFDGPTRWLGRRRWKLLHRTGMYVFGAFFLFSYVASTIVRGPLWAPFAAAIAAAWMLRVLAFARRRGGT
jgi:DMSO/TMAO reductase YedYZ heme-binding membrane subunit